jgi:hypothetical protein
MARPGERLQPIAARIFESFRDHAVDGEVLWSVYGLTCSTPEGFELADSSLHLRRIELTFRREGDEIAAGRFSLARIQLQEGPFASWLLSNYRKELSRFKVELDEEEYRGHPALRLSGRIALPNIRAVLRPRMRLTGRAWQCEEEDKIFVARWFSHRDRLEGFERFCESIPCHEPRRA